jgi:glycosyltransferase involved in cell wall biosynthesis
MKPFSPDVPVVIPAYKPGVLLAPLVEDLLEQGAPAIIVVDDGSGPEFSDVFQRLKSLNHVHVVHHAVNLGKGAALKTGLNYSQVHFPDSCGVVTADADGQHHPEDIGRIAQLLVENPDALIMGVRVFDGDVPWKSWFGNTLTRTLLRLVLGQKLVDTQTGLRGIPSTLIPHLLRITSQGYEFELDMLIACKHQARRILEEPIRTIYLDSNKSSHFHPIIDSMRIYFLLFRFSVLSLLTAALDNLVFAIAFTSTGNILQSQIMSRLAATFFNYAGARHVVFHSQQKHAVVLPKYLLLVFGNGVLSYGLLRWINSSLGLPVIPAKLCAEGLLFIANFAIQRDFVFTRRRKPQQATDWSKYYASVPATAKLTRRYTTSVLIDAIRRYASPANPEGLSIVELGGANSAFLDSILSSVGCRSYDIVDSNRYGLSLLAAKSAGNGVLRLHEQNVLALSLEKEADLVVSIGLVEHFNPSETREAVLAHFNVLRPGGTAIISFPTPTFLYRITRSLIELAGMWKFHDERPLLPGEVTASISERGTVLYTKTLWPLLLTQTLIVARKDIATN